MSLQTQIETLRAQLLDEDLSEADRVEAFDRLLECIGQPAFRRLSSRQRHDTLWLAGAHAVAFGRNDEGRRLIRQASLMKESGARVWRLRLQTAIDARDRQDVLDSLRGFLERFPTEQGLLTPALVTDAARVLRSQQDDMAVAAYAVLFDAQYRYEGVMEPSGMWHSLALAMAKRGNINAARVVAARITDVEILITLAADKRTAALLDSHPLRDNFREALARELRKLRLFQERNPRSEFALIETGELLLDAGQYDVLLELTAQALRRIETSVESGSPFDDSTGSGWLHDHRARALWALGRHDEAIVELQIGRRESESGRANASQALNLAGRLCSLERAAEARKVLEEVGPMSGYGKMVRSGIAVCAARILGDDLAVQTELNYMTEHRADSPLGLIDALLEAGRSDAAAAVLKSQLLEEDREEVLFALQRIHPGAETDRQRSMREGLWALADRPDVRAVIDQVGTIGRYDLRL